MKQRTKDRLAEYAFAASLCGGGWIAHSLGLLLPATLLYVTMGIVVFWRSGALSAWPGPWWHPLHVMGATGLAFAWPLWFYVEWTRDPEAGEDEMNGS